MTSPDSHPSELGLNTPAPRENAGIHFFEQLGWGTSSIPETQGASFEHRRLSLRLVDIALLFLFIYNVSFIASPRMTTGRVVIAFLGVLTLPRVFALLPEFLIANSMTLISLLCITGYAAVQYALGSENDNNQVSRLFHFLLYCVAGSLVFNAWFHRNLYHFLSAFSAAVLIQSFLMAYSYNSADYRSWLASVLVQGGNIPLQNGERAPGFSNSSGALLSVIQALGVFTALFAFRIAKTPPSKAFHLVVAIINTSSTYITGRTGLLMSIMFFLIFLVTGSTRHRYLMLAGLVLLGGVGVLFGNQLLEYVSENDFQSAYTRDWAMEMFSRGHDTESIQIVLDQPIPPLTPDTIFGTGLVEVNGVTVSGNDSGYIQTYYALGLIAALFFYITLLLLAIKQIRTCENRSILAGLIFVMFLIELKEPFIFKYAVPFVLFTLAFLDKQKSPQQSPNNERGLDSCPVESA